MAVDMKEAERGIGQYILEEEMNGQAHIGDRCCTLPNASQKRVNDDTDQY